MKIVFISAMTGYPWGGSEELWSQTALRLHSESHHVSASVAWWPSIHPKLQELQKQGINVFFRKPVQYRWPARLWRKIKRRLSILEERTDFDWLTGERPDLVVVSQGVTNDGLEWMDFCLKADLPYMPIVHCNAEAFWPNDDLASEMRIAFTRAVKSIFVSRHNLALLERQLGERLQNSLVVWNPFNVPSGPPPAWPKTLNNWKMACVARLEPNAKGQDLLFQILADRRWAERPVELNLYGAGKCEYNLRKLADMLHLNNVKFCGHVHDVKAIWEENHLLILPSRFEGLPITLVEAMWHARPALVTDVGGNAELCVDNETGFVSAAPVVKSIAETLERAWDQRDLWCAMGLAARRRAEQLIPNDPIKDFCQLLTNPLKVK